MGLYPSRRRQMVRTSEPVPNPPDVPLACSGLFLKEHGMITDSRGGPTLISIVLLCVGTEVEGTFRVSGSSKRMSELQAIFEAPPKVCLLALKASHLPASSSVLAPPLHQRLS